MKNKILKFGLIILLIIFLIILFIFLFQEISEKRKVKITKLENGIRVITYKMPEKYTIGMALFVEAGHKFDLKGKDGISHFMEHLAFTGTRRRTKEQIWSETKEKGIYLNAITDYNNVIYQMRLLKSDINFAFDLLSDIVQNPLLQQSEIDRERTVILQEMINYHNNPYYTMFYLALKQVFKGTSAEKETIGSPETISKVNREDLINFMKNNYYGKNMTLSVSGNVKHTDIVNLAKKYLGNIPSVPPAKEIKKAMPVKYKLTQKENFIKKDIKGSYLSLTFKGINAKTYSRGGNMANISVILDILCDGLSSRISMELRQKLGLIYSQYCGLNFFTEDESDGYFTFSINTQKEKLKEAYNALVKEIQDFPDTLTEEEVEKSVKRFKIQFLMEKENGFTLSNAISKGSDIIMFDREVNEEEMLKNLEKVNKESIIKTWNEFLLYPSKISRPALTVYGDFDKKNLPDYNRLIFDKNK